MTPVPHLPSLRKLLSQAGTEAREHVTATLQGHFESLSDRLELEFETAVAEHTPSVRREVTESMNQAVRRLRDAASSTEWSRALLDATAGFCSRAALFSVVGGRLRALDGNNLDVPLASAPAFALAAESKDPVVAMRTTGEFPPELLSTLGDSEARRVHLFPVSAGSSVTAVLYAEAAKTPLDASALELLAAVAGLAMEHRTAARKSAAGLVMPRPAAPPKQVAREWSDLSAEEQAAHLRAQRFARVEVARMCLHKSDRVKAGRASRDIYGALKDDIDAARSDFETEFVGATPTMLDYLHLELLRTLANDDAAALGSEYPGALV